ncbi:18575_t:CDS:2, partial [Gigaspora rosea]
GIPVSDETCLDENNPHLTIENLQCDGHIVLSPCDIVDVEITKKVFKVNHRMHRQDWKSFVLHHETFRTNLAIEMGISEMTLEDLYPGAYGEENYKQLYVVLKKLHVCEANERFPNNKKLTNKSDNQPIDLESGNVVVLNGTSIRMNGVRFLFMIQCKWDNDSKEMAEKTVDDEHAKNLNKLISEIKNTYEAINPNFWDVNRLKNVLDGISDASIDNNVIKKRPYINEDHFYKENPKAKKQKLDFFPLDVPGTDAYAP